MKTVEIRALVSFANAEVSAKKGEVLSVPAEMAKKLISENLAAPSTAKTERATAAPPAQKRTRKPRSKTE